MTSATTTAVRATPRDFDLGAYWQLAKPRITLVVLLTTWGGLYLAPGTAGPRIVWLTLVGTALVVAGANALNMFLERDADALMRRTQYRPLPTGRLTPRAALIFGVSTSVLSVPVLAIGVNAVTALLAVLANLSYVLAYTPLKRRSHWALIVGAVPGAIPPLLGWTAATGEISVGGLVLFAILFFWQVPHFLAIALFREDEYQKGGLVVTPHVLGRAATKHGIVRYVGALFATTLLCVPLGIATPLYLGPAIVLGLAFFLMGLWGLRPSAGDRWARALFGYSILYLVALFAALGFGAA